MMSVRIVLHSSSFFSNQNKFLGLRNVIKNTSFTWLASSRNQAILFEIEREACIMKQIIKVISVFIILILAGGGTKNYLKLNSDQLSKQEFKDDSGKSMGNKIDLSNY